MDKRKTFITQEMFDYAKERVAALQKDMILKLFDSAGVSMEDEGITEKELGDSIMSHIETGDEETMTKFILKIAAAFMSTKDTKEPKSIMDITSFVKDVSVIVSFAAIELLQERMSGSK